MLLDPLAPLELPSDELAEEPDDAQPIEATSPLEFLRAVYSDPGQPMNRRLRAAIAALPFEHPKLSVVASVEGNAGFAAKLEAAIARSGKLIECRPQGTGIESSDVATEDFV